MLLCHTLFREDLLILIYSPVGAKSWQVWLLGHLDVASVLQQTDTGLVWFKLGFLLRYVSWRRAGLFKNIFFWEKTFSLGANLFRKAQTLIINGTDGFQCCCKTFETSFKLWASTCNMHISFFVMIFTKLLWHQTKWLMSDFQVWNIEVHWDQQPNFKGDLSLQEANRSKQLASVCYHTEAQIHVSQWCMHREQRVTGRTQRSDEASVTRGIRFNMTVLSSVNVPVNKSPIWFDLD